MAQEESFSRYSARRANGASAQDVYSRARQDGVAKIDAIRVLRSLYSLSLAQANEIIYSVEGPSLGQLPVLRSYADLERVLKEELGYCGCAAYSQAIEVLRDVLRLARGREESVKDSAAFQQASEALLQRLAYGQAPGLATWFLYFLEYRGLIWHGWRATDCGLMDKGRWILEAIERFYPPPQGAEEADD